MKNSSNSSKRPSRTIADRWSSCGNVLERTHPADVGQSADVWPRGRSAGSVVLSSAALVVDIANTSLVLTPRNIVHLTSASCGVVSESCCSCSISTSLEDDSL